MRKAAKSRAEINRAAKLRHRFGLSIAQYDKMFYKQNGSCAICEKPCSSGRRLAVDHDHKTKAVRGLLCVSCNNGLGRFRDSPELLRRAAQYLNRKYPRTNK